MYHSAQGKTCTHYSDSSDIPESRKSQCWLSFGQIVSPQNKNKQTKKPKQNRNEHCTCRSSSNATTRSMLRIVRATGTAQSLVTLAAMIRSTAFSQKNRALVYHPNLPTPGGCCSWHHMHHVWSEHKCCTHTPSCKYSGATFHNPIALLLIMLISCKPLLDQLASELHTANRLNWLDAFFNICTFPHGSTVCRLLGWHRDDEYGHRWG